MSGLFVLARKASDMKFVTTKHGDAAVRFRGRHKKTTSGETAHKIGEDFFVQTDYFSAN